jgi:DnaJ-class molecular chaperone
MSGCYPYNCQCWCHKLPLSSPPEEHLCSTSIDMMNCDDKNVSPLVDKIQQLELILNNFITRTNPQMESLFCHKVYQIDENRKISKRVDKLEKSISSWEEEFYFLKDKLRNHGSVPHKCPVCDGQGGTVITDTVDEECKACEGKGIVWN